MESYDEWKGVEGLDLVGGASFFPHMSEEWKELTLKKQNEQHYLVLNSSLTCVKLH